VTVQSTPHDRSPTLDTRVQGGHLVDDFLQETFLFGEGQGEERDGGGVETVVDYRGVHVGRGFQEFGFVEDLTECGAVFQ
jgi:hypothetical protein